MTAAEVLQPALIYIGVGLAAALTCRAVRLSPLVGYLVAGVVIGPSGFGLVQSNDTSRFLAELGLVFLLFHIGLHFSLRAIGARRDDMLGLAPLQIVLCGLAFAGLGWALGFPLPVAAIVGASFALSSTVIVVRILADRRQSGGPMERSAIAVLAAQAIVAVYVLVFAASPGADTPSTGTELAIAFGMATAALILALLAGRFLIRPLFRWLAATDNRQAVTVIALFIALATSAATDRLGLSLALGAFLAGMAVSDTPSRHVVQAELKPFAGLLLGLFFMSVGMGVNLPAMAAIWPAVLLAALVIVILKTMIVFAAARLNGWALPGATQLAFLLGQGSEFTLIVIGGSTIAGAMPGAWAGILIAAVAVTLVAGPVWSQLGAHIARLLAERSKSVPVDAASIAADKPVLIFGMTREGRLVADALHDHDIPYLAIESDPERFVSAASDGYAVVPGEARDRSLLDRIGAASAPAIVLTTPGQAQSLAGQINSSGPRFVTVDDNADRLRQTGPGLRAHLSLARPRGIELVTDLLDTMGVGQPAIVRWVADQAERCGLPEQKSGPSSEAA